MVRIRLKRNGRKHMNVFRIVVVDSRKHNTTSNFICDLGYYQPQYKLRYVKINVDKYNQYVSYGAVPSTRVIKLKKLIDSGAVKNGE